jgi:methionyl-tRNA formyltransferase
VRVLFYGTPEFARPTLAALLAHHEVVGVVTQPDRPAGRGQRPQPPVVKRDAEAAGVPVLQPARLREPGWPARLAALGPEVAVVVAYGQILPPDVLAVPPGGSINVHASLLPRLRGAAPVAWAVIRGDRETGVTTFRMDAGMDTGPILLARATPVGPEETAGELAARLARLGAELLLETLARLPDLVPRPQEEGQATLAPRLRKADGVLDWTAPASALAARVRGLNPWPGAVVRAPAGRLTIWRARARPGRGVPGVLHGDGGPLVVGTGEGVLEPVEVQPENRRPMSWAAYLRGARLGPGAALAADAPRD